MNGLEQFNTMDGYTFDEGIAFLVLVKAPRGVINHLKATNNRSHLHSEIHKQLRIPRVKDIVRKNFEIPKSTPVESTIARKNEIPKEEDNSIKPKSNKIDPDSNENNPDSNENNPDSNDTAAPTPTGSNPINRRSRPAADPDSDDETDPTEIILTKDDIRTHENTRLEDMPNDLCRTIWQKRQDVYREMQQAHLKMREVPEGEEHNEERAHWREEVLRLDAENDAYWQQIDEEIERFESTKERNPESTKKEAPSFDLSTYRSYISKALRKKKLSPEQLVELQHRVDALLNAKVEMKKETIDKLKAIGITVG